MRAPYSLHANEIGDVGVRLMEWGVGGGINYAKSFGVSCIRFDSLFFFLFCLKSYGLWTMSIWDFTPTPFPRTPNE